MLTFLEKSPANVIGIKATSKLRHEDYQVLVPRLEQAIRDHGKLRCCSNSKIAEGGTFVLRGTT